MRVWHPACCNDGQPRSFGALRNDKHLSFPTGGALCLPIVMSRTSYVVNAEEENDRPQDEALARAQATGSGNWSRLSDSN